MSFMHFDTTVASGSQVIISLRNIFISESTFPTATVSAHFFGDGEAWGDDGASNFFLYNWIDPADAETLPGTVPWQIMRSNTVGDEPSGPNDGIWTDLITLNTLGLPNTTNGGTGYGNGQTVTVVGGVTGIGGTPTQFITQNVVGGVVPTSQGLTLIGGNPGKYFKGPGDIHGVSTVSYTGGTGTGLESYVSFDASGSWFLGAGYPGSAFCEFTVSIRKGTGPVLATASVELDADAS